MNETVVAVEVRVEGFEVASPGDYDELVTDGKLADAAYDIASAIGSALASLARESRHGTVTVSFDGMTATSEDEE